MSRSQVLGPGFALPPFQLTQSRLLRDQVRGARPQRRGQERGAQSLSRARQPVRGGDPQPAQPMVKTGSCKAEP